jgi:hypothetical protein
MQAPDLAKTRFVEDLHKELTSKYVLKTELLVYSLELRMAGQVDLLMRNEDSTEYHILDYKFIKEPLERKSYYNRFTRKYKMMSGPFSRLMDTTTLITAYSLRYTGILGRRWQEGENKTTYGCYSRRLRACSHDPDEDLGYYRRRACKI